MADYRDDPRWKEYGFGREMFPGGATPVASSEYTTEWYRPGATHEAALRKMVADDPSGIGILPSGLESDYTKVKTGRLGDGARIEDLGKEMPMIREDLLPYMDADRMLGPVSFTDSIFKKGEEYKVASLGDASAFEPKFGDPGVEVAEDAYWEDLIARGLPTETTPDLTPLIDAVSGKTDLSPSEKLAMGIYGTPDAEMRSTTLPLYRDTFVEDFVESPFGAVFPAAGSLILEGKEPWELSGMDYADIALTAATGLPLASLAKGPVAGFARSEWDKLREILKPTTYADKATDASTARKATDKSWAESRFAGEDPIKVREEIISDGRLLDGYPMGPSVVASLSPTTSKMDVLGYLDEIPKGIYDASALKRIKETAAAKAGMTVREFTDWYNRVKSPKELSLDDYIINVTKVPATISETGAKIYGAGLKPAGIAKELITSPITTGAAKTAGLVSLLAPRRDAEAAETLIDEALYGAEDYITPTPATSVDDFSSMYIPSPSPAQRAFSYADVDPRKPGLSYDYSGYYGPSERISWIWPDGRSELITAEMAEDPTAWMRSPYFKGSLETRTPVKTFEEIEAEYAGPSMTYIDATGGPSTPFGGVGDIGGGSGTVTSPLTGIGGFYAPISPHTGITAPVDPLAAIWT